MAKLQAAIQARVPRLEKLGEVPKDADQLDWEAAKQTSWWGKPLDPKVFWKDRVIWNDESAEHAAQRYGRFYPPVPEHVPKLMAGFPVDSRSRKDISPNGGSGPDSGYAPGYHLSDLESAYWNWFWRTKPKPLSVLQREQFEVAEGVLRTRHHWMIGGVDRDPMPAGMRVDMEKTDQERAREIGVPEEALTDEALFWCYVANCRREYQKIVSSGQNTDGLAMRSLWSPVQIDLRYLTDPPEALVLKWDNAWKISYLRRLSAANVDSSYLDAYLKAWNLRATEVFTNAPPSAPDPEWTSFEERIRQLDKRGEIPESSGTLSLLDWHAAERTSWWGKPLDPRTFWSGHAIWPGDSATSAAAHHGRLFPPMPSDDPKLPHSKNEYQDRVRLTGGENGPWLMLHYNDREVAFWKKLPRTHRDVLSRVVSLQLGIASEVLAMRREYKSGATVEQWNKLYNAQYGASLEDGFPTEAFVDDALLWCYVVKKRRDYQELVRQGHGTNDVSIEKFKQELLVDAKYLTEPPDAEVLTRANAWKIAYLRRLRSQKIHEPYMEAYLKAWNLKPEEIFANVVNAPQSTR